VLSQIRTGKKTRLVNAVLHKNKWKKKEKKRYSSKEEGNMGESPSFRR